MTQTFKLILISLEYLDVYAGCVFSISFKIGHIVISYHSNDVICYRQTGLP